MAVSDLIAARNVRRSAGSKRLTKSSHSYKHVISSLEPVGVKITYDALMKRVARASVEDSILDKIIPTITSDESEVSTLTPHEQTNDSLMKTWLSPPRALHIRMKRLKLLKSNLGQGVGPKEAQWPRRSKMS